MKKSVNIRFKREIDLDTLKDTIFDAINDYLNDGYGIDNPEEDIESYTDFVIDALLYSLKYCYPDGTNITIKYE